MAIPIVDAAFGVLSAGEYTESCAQDGYCNLPRSPEISHELNHQDYIELTVDHGRLQSQPVR